MTARVEPPSDRQAVDAAIRKHYGDPTGRRILAQRGIQFPEDDDTSADRQVAS